MFFFPVGKLIEEGVFSTAHRVISFARLPSLLKWTQQTGRGGYQRKWKVNLFSFYLEFNYMGICFLCTVTLKALLN